MLVNYGDKLQSCKICGESLKHLSHCHELGYDLLRVVNSTHLVENSRNVVGCCTQLSSYAITRRLLRSTYENFKLLKNIATTRRLKWEKRKSYRSRSALVDCRTDLVLMLWLLVRSRCLAKPGDIAQVPTSCVRVATSCYDITRY